MPAVILWGATGQAKVVRPILECAGFNVTRVFDNARVPSPFPDVPMGGGRKEFLLWRETNSVCRFAVCIRGPKRNPDRLTIYQELLDVGLEPVTAVHPRAWVSDTASIGLGSQILAMAAVCAHASMGTACIVNTNATVDHDCHLGEGVHIMPGATVAGEVVIEAFATIGSNATILPRLRIGRGAIVGAGAVATRDVPADTIVVGCPARLHRKETDIHERLDEDIAHGERIANLPRTIK